LSNEAVDFGARYDQEYLMHFHLNRNCFSTWC
jgi:hypothetical protein